jgi:P27 family predicted phage terminase small subunit
MGKGRRPSPSRVKGGAVDGAALVSAIPPECPAWLEGEAREEWKRVVAELVQLGRVLPVDRAALAAYCQTWARWREAEASISKIGLTINKDGRVYLNPAARHAENLSKLIRSYCAEFGFTPSSRGRLGASGVPTRDALDDFLNE